MSSRITQEQLNAAVWGTGYGSTRHLVNHAESRVQVPDFRSYHDSIKARCSRYTTLDFIDSIEPDKVMKRRPCKLCTKYAQTNPVPKP